MWLQLSEQSGEGRGGEGAAELGGDRSLRPSKASTKSPDLTLSLARSHQRFVLTLNPRRLVRTPLKPSGLRMAEAVCALEVEQNDDSLVSCV